MLKDTVAIVTGGSRGIGSAVSIELAKQGAHVVVNYSSSPAAAEEVVSKIKAAGGSAEAVQFNVANAEEVENAIKEVAAKAGRIDILVNNAGIASDALLVRTSVEDWQRTIDINLSGAFYCAKAVAKPMMKARTGRIINISSVIGEMGNAGQAAYSASKAGLIGLTKSMARELASRNVTVNAVTPGYIQTDMTGALTEEQKNSILSNIPLNRLGTVEDIAQTVLFLSSPAANYITGHVLSVNGGMYM